MATYVIGDVQGCYRALRALLDLIKFNPIHDKIWFTGDLVNRGAQSLEVLRFVAALPQAVCVLGNHDLSLLAFADAKVDIKQHTLDAILSAPDRNSLLNWLREQPLFYEDAALHCVLVHAGIPPSWTLEQAKEYAEEITHYLKGPEYLTFLKNMFGPFPSQWSRTLSKWERTRYIVNGLTRIRFCDTTGALNLAYKGNLEAAPPHLSPWYTFPLRQQDSKTVLFGHWAALEGKLSTPHAEALDTGCCWGGQLTALCLQTRTRYQVACSSKD